VKNNYSRVSAAKRVWKGDEDNYDTEEVRKAVKQMLDELRPQWDKLARVLRPLCKP
jgi:hypothetical protein